MKNNGYLTILDKKIIDEDTLVSIEYIQLIKEPKHIPVWVKYFANEIRRLAQDIGNRVESTDTMFFIKRNTIPENRRKDVTFGRIVVNFHPSKDDPHRTCLTFGYNIIKYPIEFITHIAALTTAKLLVNSIISTTGARFICCDIIF